ncbi:hypothetical protein ASD02_07040 [Ensifer sp. Root1252]|jgi:hypothetical protein|nr:hypothetical protein ASD00_07315 [Ensifer sp. Root31]KQW58727.1 hypothetical protein ASD02_07040 [Ensifer sp. Root1252]KQW74430.1 hypothetical protein ASD03_07680 [Ensifer sp. Root127]KQY62161.1 hypothetical protein ASD52_16190 [Ensifer sp. Root142]KRC67563.1 hypothetical protein ASE32_10500 [Ensifer sp. Root231]KRC98639.1 hypothetical protein ASE47_05695 [Ensifer sp. Root258]OMQ41599.1 hypothetical protein BKP54_28090 [Ensifer sp. 1H6]
MFGCGYGCRFLLSLISVLVTEIQPPASAARKDRVMQQTARFWFLHGADALWLDPCDEHRGEGESTVGLSVYGEAGPAISIFLAPAPEPPQSR